MKIDRRRRTELTHSYAAHTDAVVVAMRDEKRADKLVIKIIRLAYHPVIFTDVVKHRIFRGWCWIRCGVSQAVNWDLVWDSAYVNVENEPAYVY